MFGVATNQRGTRSILEFGDLVCTDRRGHTLPARSHHHHWKPRHATRFAPRVTVGAVNRHTEHYLDRGTMTLEKAWLAIWGVTPLEYLDVDSGSPAARELGLATTQPTAIVPGVDLTRFRDAFWFLGFDGSLCRWAGSTLPEGTDPLTRYFAD